MTDDLMALADTLGFQTPARRDPLKAPAMAVVAAQETGGPVQPPVAAGKEPSPGSAVVFSGAACESTGVVAGAGANVPARRARGEGRADGAVGAATSADRPVFYGPIGAATFTLPPTPLVPSFDGPVLDFGWMSLPPIEVNVCGGLDVDQVGPAHCGSSVPHRWHDLLNP